jgi:hypothetical protein
MDSTESLDRATCSFCDSETEYRFCSWRCTVQGVGPELAVEMNEDPTLVPFRTQSRDGWILDAARDFDVYDLWLNGTVADDVMASLIQNAAGKRPTDNALYRSRQGGRERRGLERISEAWTMDTEVSHCIAVDTDYLIQEAIETGNQRALEILIEDLVNRFVEFRNRYFTLGRNKPCVTAEFHKEWIAAILWSYYTGGKSMILAPPRSGKSELLSHFTTWLVVRNPDIRIAWVGGNTDIASDMVSSVRRHLESNERLVAETLPDGVTYAPQGRGSVGRGLRFGRWLRLRVGCALRRGDALLGTCRWWSGRRSLGVSLQANRFGSWLAGWVEPHRR